MVPNATLFATHGAIFIDGLPLLSQLTFTQIRPFIIAYLLGQKMLTAVSWGHSRHHPIPSVSCTRPLTDRQRKKERKGIVLFLMNLTISSVLEFQRENFLLAVNQQDTRTVESVSCAQLLMWEETMGKSHKFVAPVWGQVWWYIR